MVNLAVDSTDLGENVLFGSIGLKDRNKTPGTKLNPIEINENTTNTTFGNLMGQERQKLEFESPLNSL